MRKGEPLSGIIWLWILLIILVAIIGINCYVGNDVSMSTQDKGNIIIPLGLCGLFTLSTLLAGIFCYLASSEYSYYVKGNVEEVKKILSANPSKNVNIMYVKESMIKGEICEVGLCGYIRMLFDRKNGEYIIECGEYMESHGLDWIYRNRFDTEGEKWLKTEKPLKQDKAKCSIFKMVKT